MNNDHERLMAGVESMDSGDGCATCRDTRTRMSSYDDDGEFLLAHHILQSGLMFDHAMHGVGGLVYGLSDWTEDPAWNNAVVTRPSTNVLSDIDYSYLHWSHNRAAALSFPKGAAFAPVERILSRNGWAEGLMDQWMIYMGPPPDPSIFSGTVDEVQTADELAIFIETLRHAREDTNPHTNPYGRLPENHAGAIARAWHRGHRSGRVKYYIKYDRERSSRERVPVAVASLTCWADRFGRSLGHIANIGTDPRYREHGNAREVTLSCISEVTLAVCVLESYRQGNTVHSLATAPDKAPIEVFSKIGFKKRMRSAVWSEGRFP